jgi:hypothetical protein
LRDTCGAHAHVPEPEHVTEPTLANSDAYYPIMRYAEILLIYAEAANEANGAPTTEAYAQLNAIRSRSKATLAPAAMNLEQFRSYVLSERARELLFEGIRRFDLIRWNVYLQVMNKISAGQNNISKVRSQRNLLLPIPLGELNSNQSIRENNPGW